MENTEGSNKSLTLKSVLAWIIGTLFLISGVTSIGESFGAGLFFIIASLLILPITYNFLANKSKTKLSTGLRVFVILVCLIIGFSILGSKSIDKKSDAQQGDVIQEDKKDLEIVDISTKVIEQNSVWWKYAWNLKLKNNTNKTKTVTAEIEWIDEEGFVVDSKTKYSLEVGPNQEVVFSDFALINSDIAGNVKDIQAEIK